jgi:hypothetical protein
MGQRDAPLPAEAPQLRRRLTRRLGQLARARRPDAALYVLHQRVHVPARAPVTKVQTILVANVARHQVDDRPIIDAGQVRVHHLGRGEQRVVDADELRGPLARRHVPDDAPVHAGEAHAVAALEPGARLRYAQLEGEVQLAFAEFAAAHGAGHVQHQRQRLLHLLVDLAYQELSRLGARFPGDGFEGVARLQLAQLVQLGAAAAPAHAVASRAVDGQARHGRAHRGA